MVDYKEVLDSFQTIGVYVIREDNHEILYFNKRVEQVTPDVKVGMACHQIWSDFCGNCPVSYIEENGEGKSVHYDNPFGKVVEIRASRVLWGEIIPAFVITLTPQAEVEFPGEDDNKRNQEIIKFLGRMNFGVYDIDLEDGSANPIRSAEDIPEIKDFNLTDWQELLGIKLKRHIHPQSREEFFREFSIEALRNMEKNNEKRRELVCLRKFGEEYRYVTAVAHLYHYGCKSHVVLALQDVDEQMRTEIAHAQSDRRMAAIIKSRYNVMNTVYLDTGLCERSYLDQPEMGERWGDYDQYIRGSVGAIIYEEDIPLFMEKMSMESLRKKAAAVKDFLEEQCQYRVNRGQAVIWVEQHILYIRQDDQVVVNILGRDITQEKLAEAEAVRVRQERTTIINTMSSMFFAAYYVDLVHDTFRRISQREEVGEVLGCEENYTEGIRLYCRQFVSPLDQEEYSRTMRLDNLKRALSPSHPLVAMEYRSQKKQEGEGFAWIRITVILAESEKDAPKIALYVAQDVTESKRREAREHRALKEAYEAATLANASKSEFLSRMSHDIRTPMNAILGMTAIAEKHLEEPERVRECLRKIGVSSNHLLSLINEVLDMSKIESGKMDLTDEDFNLSDLFRNLVTMTRPAVQDKGHSLNIRFEEVKHLDVTGDMVRLQQVFINILSNAIKYTPPGGKLNITIIEKDSPLSGYGCYEFVFCDNGIGMARDFQEKIFEPFSRAEDSRISKIEGTGLGMAIAWNIIQRMNGEIQVESQLGRGSRFTVIVFLKKRASEPPRELAAEPEREEREAGTDTFEGFRVLMVEDNELNMEIAVEIIEEIGAKVESAYDGREAVEMFEGSQEGYYDLIFMDIQMPRMNGYEATRAIRAMDREDAKRIPIIAITANAFTDDRISSRQAGMNEHLSKPINIEALEKCMGQYLKERRQP